MGRNSTRFVGDKRIIEADINIEVEYEQKQLEKRYNEPADYGKHDNNKEDKRGYNTKNKIKRKSLSSMYSFPYHLEIIIKNHVLELQNIEL